MNHRSVPPAAYALLAPLLLIFTSVILPMGCSSSSSSSSSTPQPTQGSVEVGLVDAPSSAFQSINLNVVSVRLNTLANATNASTGWVVVPVPVNVGGAGGIVTTNLTGGGVFFNQAGIAGPGRSEIQIDLNTLQDNVQIFNTVKIPAQNYKTVQLQLDQNTPANIVPNCGNGPSPQHEGCVSYAAALASPYALATSTTIPIGKNVLTPLIIEVNPQIPVPPTSNGGKYGFQPIISVLPNSGTVGAKMALVSGTVHGDIGASPRVSAIIDGTTNIVASANVASTGAYAFQLPVAADGTTYDLFFFGNGSSYDVLDPLPLTRGEAATDTNFNSATTSVGSLQGTITDACTTNPINVANVYLLTSPGGTTDCVTSPASCVAVASTTTDPTGFYPQPGRTNQPKPFSQIPSAKDGTYALMVTAAGYDTAVTAVDVNGTTVTCPTQPDSKCNFSLGTAYIRGTVSLGNTVPTGNTAEIQVFAEDPSTDTIVSALPFPVSIPPCTTVPCTTSFLLNVPTSPSNFDVYATAMDLFNGVPNQFTGHTVGTVQDVPSSSQCPAPTTATVSIPTLECTGHGSVSGVVNPPYDSNTNVVLLKDGVQIQGTTVGPVGTDNAGAFSFCAPADAYQVQRFESSTPVGTPTAVLLPAPEPTTSPCPSICSQIGGTCPSNCANTTLDEPL